MVTIVTVVIVSLIGNYNVVMFQKIKPNSHEGPQLDSNMFSNPHVSWINTQHKRRSSNCTCTESSSTNIFKLNLKLSSRSEVEILVSSAFWCTSVCVIVVQIDADTVAVQNIILFLWVGQYLFTYLTIETPYFGDRRK